MRTEAELYCFAPSLANFAITMAGEAIFDSVTSFLFPPDAVLWGDTGRATVGYKLNNNPFSCALPADEENSRFALTHFPKCWQRKRLDRVKKS